MNVLLRKITITSNDTIKVLKKNKETNWLGKEKEIETVEEDLAVYEYWIEFHIDQCRFYYGERKPILVDYDNQIYEYQISTSHTKRNLDRSLEILSGIANRAKIIYPEWDYQLYNKPDMVIYRQFDKDYNENL